MRMKRIKFFAVAACLAISSGAYAQFTNTSSSSSSTNVNTDGWGTFYAEYNPSAFVPKHGDNESFSAFSLGLSKAFSVTQSAPVFLEAGIAAQYSFKSDFLDYDDINFKMFSAKVPFSLIYKFDLPNSSISLMPNAGLDCRFNILAKLSDDDDSVDLFDKDDMGSSKDTWNRFQIGWHIGLKALLGQNFLIGASYGSDFSEIEDDTHIQTISLTLGYTF